MSIRKAVLAGTAAATAGIAITATTAMAAPMPGPVHHGPVPRPESFTIAINGLTNLGTATAKGPVNGVFASKDTSSTNETWTMAHGSADITHTAVTAVPAASAFTVANACTASITATGNWYLRGLTGIDRDARGAGKFSATVTEVMPVNTTYTIEKVVKVVLVKVRVHHRHGRDTFKLVPVREVRYVKVPVKSCGTTPTAVTVAVTGTGLATNGR